MKICLDVWFHVMCWLQESLKFNKLSEKNYTQKSRIFILETQTLHPPELTVARGCWKHEILSETTAFEYFFHKCLKWSLKDFGFKR